MSNLHRTPDDHTGAVKTAADLVPTVVQSLIDAAAARREKRLRGLRLLHQRQRDLEAGRKLNHGGAK